MLKRFLMGGAAVAAVSLGAIAQDAPQKVEAVVGNLHVVFARAGNVGISAGEDGVFLIDDQYAPMTAGLKAAVASVSDAPVRYVINTHYHGDHTGGNENLGAEGTVMVSHDNVRQRLKAGSFVKEFNMRTPPASKAGLPAVTFNSEMSLHLNGDEARIIHVENAHTDGDSMVFFKGQNVLYTGDVFFHGMFPFIDVDHGGSIGGMIAAIDRAIALVDENTKVVPGHGPVTDKAGLAKYRDFLQDSSDIVAAHKAAGKSLEEIVAMKPFATHAETRQAFNPAWIDTYVGFVFTSLK
jgi:cyclase